MAPLSGYLLYLYSAARTPTYLREAERIMDLTLTHMQDDRGWILERFAADWTFRPDDPKNSHINVGHNAEVAWLLLRLHALTGKERYRRKGLALTDKLLRTAFRDETGAWRHELRRTDPARHPDTAVWWVQAHGNMLQLYAYCATGADRYLDAFRKGARFWMDAFVDADHGGTVLRTTLDGTVVDGEKAVRTKTSYHAVEHALLASLYLDLWARGAATTLHYRLDSVQDLSLSPPLVEDTPRIERVLVDGTPRPRTAFPDGTVRLPDTLTAPVRLQIDLSSPSFP
ncbi:AGE family epimerase/isomerase [Salinibacter grassmerensis]|uniref:AGE family epimerase/isomerase n=1 Tax=Salinibacter grassmerensis TaxID=3040353 RepID=UPI0021E838C8|nr:AGE family epimerase/isomerase [Salinibacter grassmerensis]